MTRLRSAILAWHDANRRVLPWNDERDPYRVWLSEIMLQQTRTGTAEGYYKRFLEKCPDVHDLAALSEEEVLKLWEGLGYYSRARNLHKTAKIVSHERGGVFPGTAKELMTLPGIGEYTAGAIASAAFGEEVPAIDANQIRVLARLFAVDTDVTKREGRTLLREKAQQLICGERPGDFNQALMGMGALVCLPMPECEKCPAREMCLARRMGIERELPRLPEKKEKRTENRAVALVFCNGAVLVRKREDKGLLASLWEFPNFLEAHNAEDTAEALAELGAAAKYKGTAGEAKHVFTHVVWNMKGYVFEAKETNGLRFVNADELSEIAMASAFSYFREKAREMLENE